MSVIVVSAAIYGLRNKSNISIFILHPKGRVSPIQEAQMTTVTDANVHNLAVKGTFDDCQVCIFHVELCTLIRSGYLLDNILRTSSRHSSVTKNSTRSTDLVQSTLSTGLVSLLRPSTTSSRTSTSEGRLLLLPPPSPLMMLRSSTLCPQETSVISSLDTTRSAWAFPLANL